MPVIIDNAHGRVTIPNYTINVFELVIGPVNLFLQGQALGNVGRQINNGLGKYTKGDVVQVIDQFKLKYSGVYEIAIWNLSSTGNLQKFDLQFKSK